MTCLVKLLANVDKMAVWATVGRCGQCGPVAVTFTSRHSMAVRLAGGHTESEGCLGPPVQGPPTPPTHPARIDAAGPASSPSLPRFDFLSAVDVGDILPTGPQFVASCVHNQHILTAVPGVFMCPPTTRHTRTSSRLLFILLLEGKPEWGRRRRC